NGAGRATTLRSTAPKKPRVPRKSKAEKAAEKASEPTVAPSAPARPEPPAPTPITQPRAAAGAPKAASGGADKVSDKPRQDNGGAQILSLDAFRKK
ncbi:MAG TPA: hypothetical protein VH852_06505, partial [Hyphomicrobium sp.]